MMGIFLFCGTGAVFARQSFPFGDFMKSSILRAGVVALACALGLSACGGGSGDLPLTGTITNVDKNGALLQNYKAGLVLTNNGGDDFAVPSPYTSFQFGSYVSTDDEFNIQVKAAPSNIDHCVVNNGKARANYYTIAQIQIVCFVRTRQLTVTVNNLTTPGLVIVNGTDRKEVPPNTPSVAMAEVYQDGAYGVSVLQQPTGQTCTVGGGDNGKGSGTVGATDISNVLVNCT
jgi:hypothetical protein